MINEKTVSAISSYFEFLYNININILKLVGINYYNVDVSGEVIFEIVQNIPRIIPYKYKDEIKKNVLLNGDGLMEFKNDIPFLKDRFNQILGNNSDILENIKKIRNKYEHKIQNITSKWAVGSGVDAIFCFDVDGKSLVFSSKKLIDLVVQMNDLFSVLANLVIEFARENNLTNYKIYEKIARFDFKDFNEIYRLDLVEKIGMFMFDF